MNLKKRFYYGVGFKADGHNDFVFLLLPLIFREAQKNGLKISSGKVFIGVGEEGEMKERADVSSMIEMVGLGRRLTGHFEIFTRDAGFKETVDRIAEAVKNRPSREH